MVVFYFVCNMLQPIPFCCHCKKTIYSLLTHWIVLPNSHLKLFDLKSGCIVTKRLESLLSGTEAAMLENKYEKESFERIVS